MAFTQADGPSRVVTGLDESSTVYEALSRATASHLRSREAWQPVIDALVETLAEHLGQPMEVDPDPMLVEQGLSLWIFADGTSAPTTWSGVLSARFREQGGLDVGFIQFIFDANGESRIRSEEGDFIAHILQATASKLDWIDLGWEEDTYDEWDDVPFPDDDDHG